MNSSAAAAPRLAWADLTRFVGAFLVVLAHVVTYPNLMGQGTFWAQTAYYTLTRTAVPLFFMLSGMLLLSKQEALGLFFRKRALKVVFPFLVWSLLYYYWYNASSPGAGSFSFFLLGIVKTLKSPRAAHLWFFYSLIGLYAAAPILRVFTAGASKKDLLYFCGAWLFVVPLLAIIHEQFSILVDFEFPFLTGYIGYFVLGFFLNGLPLTRRLVLVSALALAVSLIFTFFAIYLGSQSPHYDQFYEQYLSLNVIVMSASAFLLLKSINHRIPASLNPWLIPLGGAAYGIYLFHVLVMDVFSRYWAGGFPILQTGRTVFVMPLVGGIAFVFCLVTILVLQKIPLLKYLVP
ncbi:MAG TPA: acyltransferase family protein [Anaerolineales bacterium]|nr:acyltransferase family protein [Anaerolineales bacterium]